MDAIVKLHQFLESQHKYSPFEIWLQKPHESTTLLFGCTDCKNTTLPSSTSPMQANKYQMNAQVDNHVCYYFYPNHYVITLYFPLACPVFNEEDHEQIWLILHLLYHTHLVQHKQNQTEKLIEGIRSISSSLDLNDLLRNLVQIALEVINAADAGIVHLYQPDIDRLVSKGVVGFDEEKMQHFKLKVGESIAGKVFKEGKARNYSSLSAVMKGMNNISEENRYYLNSARDLSHLQSLMCVPVSIADEVLGTMSIHTFQPNTQFSEEDLFLLQGFAFQAAIAIQNAFLYTQTKTTLENMAQLSEFLIKRNEVHHALTRISLQNKGIEPIIVWLNQTLDQPVYFFDYIENKMYPRTPSRSPWIDISKMQTTIFKKRTTFYMNVSDNPTISFFIYPIWLGSVSLGFLLVETNGDALSEIETITLEQSSNVLALELIKQRTLAETYYKKTHEYFRELIENKDPEQLTIKSKEFGIHSFTFGLVMILEMQTSEDLQKTEVDIHRLILRIKHALPGKEKILFGYHHQITIMVNLSDPTMKNSTIELVRTILTQFEKGGDALVYGGIGSVAQGIHDIAKSYEEAKKALAYATKMKKRGLLSYEELGVNRLFLHHSQPEIEKFIEEVFSPLQIKGKDSYLEQTLRVYMATDRSVNETAQTMHIHVNTLYQRLRKIEELLNLSFDNVEDILKLQLVCFLKDTQVN